MDTNPTPAPENTEAVVNGIVKKTISFIRGEMILRGVVFALIGLLMLFKPVTFMTVITVCIGVLILLDGISLLFAALKYKGSAKTLAIIGAVLLILLGVCSCTSPLLLDTVWIIMIGIWLFFSGIQSLFFTKNAPLPSLFSGILSILIGILFIGAPLLGLASIFWLSGLMLLISGLAAVIFGIRLKSPLN